MSIVFQYPTWFLLLAVLAGAAYALGMYFREKRTAEMPIWMVRGLAAMRGITIFILVVLLIGPLIKSVTKRTEKPIVVIAQDNSSSIPLNSDSAFYRKEYLEALAILRKELSDEYEVRSYTFGNAVKETETPDFADGRTDMSELFEELDNVYANRNVGAVVLASDGLYNRGRDPIYSPLHLNAPIYSIALGDTSIKRDVILKKVDHNRYAYLGNEFPVEITLEAEKFQGKEVTVQLSAEKGILWEQKVSINSNSFRKVLSAKLKAETPGLNRIKASVSVLSGELSRSNNTQDFFVEVLDGRQKVLILAANPHPDIAALKRSISGNDNYEVDAMVLGEREFNAEQYDLIILHQLPQQGGAGRPEMDKVRASTVPVFCIVGSKTDLRWFNDMNFGLQINAARQSKNQVLPVFAKGFSLFTLDENVRRMLQRFPPLNAPFGEYAASGSAQTLFNQRIGNVETQNPLLLFNDVSGRKTGVLVGDGIWKWRIRDFEENGSHEIFDAMLSKVVQFLALKTDKSLFRVNTKNRYSEDEAIVFNAELYNETYEPVNEPEVDLTITDESGKVFEYKFNRTDNSYRLNAGSFKEGNYRYKAQVSNGGKVLESSGQFMVAAQKLETTRTTADHALMHKIANGTGGELFYPRELENLAQAIKARDDIRNVVYEQTWFKEAIHLKWIFFLILALLSVEWFVRKRNGAY
ncbi:MAG: hypothetical protein K9J17_15040 [Flavobacteriales bacterium]|nr:hypothetical protein [Flavobacteriales bacterium]